MVTKYTIKIPKNLTILYSNKKKILTVKGPINQKSIKLKIKILLIQSSSILKVTQIPFYEMSNKNKKTLKALQGTTAALIQQLFIETSYLLYQKLFITGVGYRAFNVDNLETDLLMFKLGYSHPIYFRIPKNLRIVCLKFTKIFLYGNSYNDIRKIASLIRLNKKPEPYKGKGILFENEKIKLKEGKKS